MNDWSDVRTGWAVEDKEGNRWDVEACEPGQVFRIRCGKRVWSGVRKGPVKVLSGPEVDREVDLAKGLLAVKFGAVEVGKRPKDRSRPFLVPPTFDEPGSASAHLFMFHGVTTQQASLAGMLKEHDDLHGPQERAGMLYEPHEHDPNYAKR